LPESRSARALPAVTQSSRRVHDKLKTGGHPFLQRKKGGGRRQHQPQKPLAREGPDPAASQRIVDQMVNRDQEERDMTSRSIKRILAAAVLSAVAASPALAGQHAGRWVAGDFHQHSYVTDGSNALLTVQQKGFDFGLDWQANSEHGGTSDEAGDDPRQRWNLRLDPSAFLGSPNPYPNLWRWQTLADADKVPAYLDAVRAANPSRLVINGMEMNMPGAEHCSTAILDPTGYDIAQFEYLWDRSDRDASGGYGFEDPANGGVSKNFVNDLAKAAQAAAWMQANFAGRGWMVPAHPERAADQDWSDGNPSGYGPNFFRTLNDAGPDVCFAFESAPGHQKDSGRGGYGSGAYGGGTYGGVGHFAATVGGLWDALLGEGREFWLVASSDFHSTGGDFWPGEYQRTYSYMRDANGNGEEDGEDIVASLRSGNMFIVHGDLINELDFRVFHGAASANKVAHGHNSATMGENLTVENGDKVTVRVRFKSPAANNCLAGDNAPIGYVCQAPSVQHVQLIAGEVTGRLTPGTVEYTTQGTNPTTKVVATYDPTTWSITEDGSAEFTYVVRNVGRDMYFRVRGSNLGPGTEFETDEAGNPLSDTLVFAGLGLDGAAEAWSDLWFYSNPIFVTVRD
jgi:hypothetical protein